MFSVDLRSLALLRMALGALLLVDLAQRARFLEANYTDAGVLPRVLAPEWLSVHLLGDLPLVLVLFALAALFAVMLLVGHHTRIATVVSWVLLTSVQHRNPFLLDGGDVIARMLLLWSIFLPLGGCWSIDARRRTRPPSASPVFSIASLGIMCQFVLLYVFGGLAKSGADWMQTGLAIERALRQSYWTAGREVAQLLLSFPEALRIVSLTVPFFERLGPIFMFIPVWTTPIRLLAILSFWLFQLGLGLCIQLNLFPFFSTATTLVFVPRAFWDRVLALMGRRAPGAAPSVLPKRHDLRVWPQRLTAFGLALLLLYQLLANLETLGVVRLPRAVSEWPTRVGVVQRWMMYAPESARADFWFDIRGRLEGGEQVRLLEEVERLGDGPFGLKETHGDYRFKIFLESLAARAVQGPRGAAYADWLCRKWNEHHSDRPRLEHVWVYRLVRPIGRSSSIPAHRSLLVRRDCPTDGGTG